MIDADPGGDPGRWAEPGSREALVPPTRLKGSAVLPAIVLVLGVGVALAGIGGRLTSPPETSAAPSPSAAPASSVPFVVPAIEEPPVSVVALLGIDLPPAIGSYEASQVLATLQVFGRVTDPSGKVVAELRDEDPWMVLGTATAVPASDGRFRADLPFLPPVGGGRVVLELREPAGAVLATVPYVIRTRGPIVFRSPDRLEGWREGETVEVSALVRGGATRALVRLASEDGRVGEERIVSTRPAEDGWRSISAELSIPPDLPFGRAWLEVEAIDRGEEPNAVARLLLRVAP